MENPIWNLVVKVASALALCMLVIGIVLLAGSYAGMLENKVAGDLTIFCAGLLSVFALVVANLENSKLKRQQKCAVEAAYELSQGKLFEAKADTELLDSLGTISAYLKAKSALANRIASGDLFENMAPLSDSDALGKAMQNMVE